jgi:hypothetical protein
MGCDIFIHLSFAEDKISKSPLSLESSKGLYAINPDKLSIGVIGEGRILPPGDAWACQDFFDRARPLA